MGVRPLVWSGLLTLLVTVVAVAAWTMASPPEVRPAPGASLRAAEPTPDAVACLGRIQPEDGIVHLAARSLTGQPSIVARLFVKEGDAVHTGQVVATLNSRDQLEAAWQAAEARVTVANARLAQITAGAKPADLQAQRAEIARLDAEHANADREYRRMEGLHGEHVVTDAELDAHRTRAESTAQSLAQARERLTSLADVRDVDVAYGTAEQSAAKRAAHQARMEFEQAEVRSPIDGRVIAIHAWPGAEAGAAGIMEVGKTDRMYVVAEVDVSDLPQVKVGQRATITGSGLNGTLGGVVESIGLAVASNGERHLDPLKPSDARIVETKIKIDDPGRAVGLINAQVTVRIAR